MWLITSSLLFISSLSLANTCVLPGEEAVLKAISEAQKRANLRPAAPAPRSTRKTEQMINESITESQQFSQRRVQQNPGEEAALRKVMGHEYRVNVYNQFELGNYGKAISFQEKAGDQFIASKKLYQEKFAQNKASISYVNEANDNALEAYRNAGRIDKILEHNLLPKGSNKLDDLADSMYNQAMEIRGKRSTKLSIQGQWETIQMLKLGLEACKKTDGFARCKPAHFEEALRNYIPRLEQSISSK